MEFNKINKYENNELIMGKIHNYIVVQLPNIIENISNLNEEKIKKNKFNKSIRNFY